MRNRPSRESYAGVIMNEVRLEDLPVIQGDKGNIVKIFRSNDPKIAPQEIYISSVAVGVTKGCKLHKAMTCKIKVISGEVTFHFFGNDKKKKQSIKLSKDDHRLLVIPPGNWFAFENTSNVISEVINFADILHDPQEQINEDPSHFSW